MARNQSLYGTPYYNAAQQSGMNTLKGDYFGPGLADNPYANSMSYDASNPYIGQYTGDISVGQNALLGMNNPYLNSAINQAQSEVVNQYRDVTTPQLQAMQRQAGAFGNTGLQQQQNQALSELTKNMGDISNSMRMQDYGLQAQLGEADLARQLSVGQSNQNTALSDLQRNSQLAQDMSQYNATNYAQDLSRNAATNEAQFTRQQNAWDSERDNQMRSMSLAPQFFGTDKQRAQTLLGVGDIYRDYNQNIYNQNYQDWLSKQQQPYQNLDVLANAIRTSMGGGGSSVTSSPNAYQSNSTASALGGGLLGYGVGGAMGYPTAGAIGGGLLGLWG